ncbi:HD domain-containing phosphohydrolase [Solidesulfovibrio alcoholivorans]|uniref:HD domain-containing phosphohydrolase n=1 Tax=Solidesulfovibrio alcoholivorans TaxID=81406 RepID=UPI00049832AD|nr:HD domain-containing phosphohydrolase [Solidesulfovibrio alcoholivorans]
MAEASPRPRVLVVEDEAIVVMDLRRRLERLGYELAAVADTGEEAVRLAGVVAPDLALMDIMLAGPMDGIAAAARIRERFSVPVVFLSAHTDPETLRRAGEAVPHGYVIKPFEDRELGTALEIALYRSRMERRLAENERWMAMTLAHLGEGVVTTGPDGLVRFVNPMAEKLLARPGDEVLGRTLAEVYQTRADEDMESDDGDSLLLCRADGASLPVEQRFSDILDDRGQRLGSVVVFRDISRRREVEQALRESVVGLRRTLKETVNALTVTSETRDPFTAGHQERVSHLASALAARLGCDADTCEGIRVAGLIHDIGKIHVPSEILAKPQSLTPLEIGIVRDHSRVGYDILKDIPFPWPVARMVLEHHERMDGSGYPHGLSGEAQLQGSRILAVADVAEAMTSHRPYRAAFPLEAMLDELRDGRGVRYDAAVVDACLEVLTDGTFQF